MDLIIVITSLAVVVGLLFTTRLALNSIYFRLLLSSWKRRAREIAHPTTSTILIFGSDISSDGVGLSLCEAIRKETKDRNLKHIYTNGVGGPEMKAADIVDDDVSEYSTVGYGDAAKIVFLNLPGTLLGLRAILDNFQERPDLVILLSNPGLNLYIAWEAAQRHIPVIYILPPENWAYDFMFVTKIQDRILARCVTQLYTDFEFEVSYFEGVVKRYRGRTAVKYLGNPLVDQIPDKLMNNRDNEGYKKQLRTELFNDTGWKWTIGLIPGSRPSEIRKHLPLMLKAGKILAGKQKYKGRVQFLLPVASSDARAAINRILKQHPREEHRDVRLIRKNRRHEAMFVCDLVVASSGTATLEAACLGIPSIIIYRIGALDRCLWRLGIMKLTEGFIGLPNLLAKKTIFPELKKAICPEIVGKVTPVRIVNEMTKILDDPELARRIRSTLVEIGKTSYDKGIGAIASDIATMIAPLPAKDHS